MLEVVSLTIKGITLGAAPPIVRVPANIFKLKKSY